MNLNNFFALSARMAVGTLVFSLIGALTSCSSDDSIPEPVVNPETSSEAISFATNIEYSAATRAYDGTFDTSDNVGVFMTNTSGILEDTHHKENHQYVAAITATTGEGESAIHTWGLNPFNTANNLYYPADDSQVSFIAYYPYKDLSQAANGTLTGTDNDSKKVPGTYIVNLGTQDLTTAKTFDFLYAEKGGAYKRGGGKPSMTFKHQLSKVVVNVKLKDDEMDGADIDDMVVTINKVPTKAIFNLAKGAYDALDIRGNVIMTELTELTESAQTAGYTDAYQALIVPHAKDNKEATGDDAFTDRTITFAFKDPDAKDAVITYTIPNEYTDEDGEEPDESTEYKEFKKEKLTIYNFTLAREKVIFDKVTVVDWVLDEEESLEIF